MRQPPALAASNLCNQPALYRKYTPSGGRKGAPLHSPAPPLCRQASMASFPQMPLDGRLTCMAPVCWRLVATIWWKVQRVAMPGGSEL